MRDPFRNYDAWKTASPYDDEPEPSCPGCGADFPEKPTKTCEDVFVEEMIGDSKPERGSGAYDIRRVGEMWEWKIKWIRETRIWKCEECGYEYVEDV